MIGYSGVCAFQTEMVCSFLVFIFVLFRAHTCARACVCVCACSCVCVCVCIRTCVCVLLCIHRWQLLSVCCYSCTNVSGCIVVATVMQIHNLQSQLQAAGVAVDPSILEACQLPEALTRPLPPRGSSQGVQDGSIKTEGGLEDDDYEDDDDEDDEEEDDEQEYSRSGTRAAGFGNAS